MNTIRSIQRLNQRELEQGIPPSASWHVDYRHTAYVHVGGLSFDLTEGDVITIFSQFGEPTFCKLARDKATGKSRGFGWVKYEDQRSCDLAVDNLGGATVLGRVLKVDHAEYRKREGESDGEEEGRGNEREGEAEGGKEVEREEAKPRRPLLKEEIELQKLIVEHDDDDPMKEYLVGEKKAEVEKALERQRRKDEKLERRERRDHGHRDRDPERDRDRKRRDESEDSYEKDRRRRHRDGRRRGGGEDADRRRERRRSTGRSRSREPVKYRVADGARDRTPPRRNRRQDYDSDERERDETPVASHGRRNRSPEDDTGRRRHRRSRSP